MQSARGDVMRRFWAQLITRSLDKTKLLANRTTTKDHWLSAGIGRAGFGLNLTLMKDAARAELYIRSGDETQSLAVFRNLESQKAEIESIFGAALDWQDLPGRLGCRICVEMDGGWNLPESEWPSLQDRMIDALIRLDTALRDKIQKL